VRSSNRAIRLGGSEAAAPAAPQQTPAICARLRSSPEPTNPAREGPVLILPLRMITRHSARCPGFSRAPGEGRASIFRGGCQRGGAVGTGTHAGDRSASRGGWSAPPRFQVRETGWGRTIGVRSCVFTEGT